MRSRLLRRQRPQGKDNAQARGLHPTHWASPNLGEALFVAAWLQAGQAPLGLGKGAALCSQSRSAKNLARGPRSAWEVCVGAGPLEGRQVGSALLHRHEGPPVAAGHALLSHGELAAQARALRARVVTGRLDLRERVLAIGYGYWLSSFIQWSGEVPSASASPLAVCGVMARLPAMSSLMSSPDEPQQALQDVSELLLRPLARFAAPPGRRARAWGARGADAGAQRALCAAGLAQAPRVSLAHGRAVSKPVSRAALPSGRRVSGEVGHSRLSC